MEYSDRMKLRGIIVAGFLFRMRLESGIKLSERAIFDYYCPEIIALWRNAGLY